MNPTFRQVPGSNKTFRLGHFHKFDLLRHVTILGKLREITSKT